MQSQSLTTDTLELKLREGGAVGRRGEAADVEQQCGSGDVEAGLNALGELCDFGE